MLALTHWVKLNRPNCFLGDKRTGGKDKLWVGQGSSEIKFDSLTLEEYNLWSTEKLDLTATKQSKTLTVPKQGYKYTPKSASSSDEEILTLSKWNITLSAPKVSECLIGVFSAVSYNSTHIYTIYESQDYIKGSSKFSRSMLSTCRHRVSTWQNTWPPKITHTIQYMIIHIILQK